MSLRKASIAWNSNQLTKMIAGKKISFDNIVQRSFVWERKRKSELIQSMIIGYPIPPIYTKRSDDRVYDVLDGKQRLMTVSSFLNNEFALTDLEPVPIIDVATEEEKIYDISGKKFSELPEEIQEILKSSTFTVYYFDDITKDETREMFRRINAGKPLSVKEKNIANCNDLETIIEIGGHGLFEDMLTKKAYDAKAYVPLIVKIYLMLNEDISNVSFESGVFNQKMSDISITSKEQEYMEEIFDLIEYIHATLITDGDSKKIAKKFYKETHLVSLIPFIKLALDEKYDEDIFTDWIMKFFDSEEGASISNDYNNACLAGSAKPENVQKRNNALKANFNEFYSKIENPRRQ